MELNREIYRPIKVVERMKSFKKSDIDKKTKKKAWNYVKIEIRSLMQSAKMQFASSQGDTIRDWNNNLQKHSRQCEKDEDLQRSQKRVSRK